MRLAFARDGIPRNEYADIFRGIEWREEPGYLIRYRRASLSSPWNRVNDSIRDSFLPFAFPPLSPLIFHRSLIVNQLSRTATRDYLHSLMYNSLRKKVFVNMRVIRIQFYQFEKKLMRKIVSNWEGNLEETRE